MLDINNIKLPGILLVIILIQFTLINDTFAQPVPPPKVITVNATQELHFGTFSLQSGGSPGGTVTVDYSGNRTFSGQIILLSEAPLHQPAIFEINLCQGRNVIITYPATTILSGNNGGTLILNIGPTEKGPSGTAFQVDTDCSFITQIRVGGTLTVGNNAANPAGTYSGSFNIIFNQQ